MIESYKFFIETNESVNLNLWNVPELKINIAEDFWHLPYGDDPNDIYLDNALRSDTLREEIKSKGWKGAVIKNKSGDPHDNSITNIHHTYDSLSDLIKTFKMFKGKWTGIGTPVKEYVEKYIEPYLIIGHVYILKIESHGFIKEHRDVPKDYDPDIHKNFNTLNTFMAPINDPCHSYFILNNKRINLKKGTVTWFNSSLPHVFFNTSNDTKEFLLFTGLAKKRWIEVTVNNMLH